MTVGRSESIPIELTEVRLVSASFDFAKEEGKVIQFWRDIDAFQTSLKLSEGRPEYSFYDGPPFATGLPHYGHLLAGTIKVRLCRCGAYVIYRPERSGYRYTTCTRERISCSSPFWMGYAWIAC